MTFRIKAEKLGVPFMLPTEVVDRHIKLAGTMQLKVILYCYRHLTEGIDVYAVAEALSISADDVNDALMFWCELGLLDCDRKVKTKSAPEEKKVQPHKTVKPSRSEVARRGTESPEIAFLLSEAQVKFGRTLKQSESSALVWLFDDLGLDASVILMVIEYALQAGRCNVAYIEKIGKDWADGGVLTIQDAENKIIELGNARSAWNVMRTAFGLDRRAPSESEQKMAVTAVNEWGMSRDVLKSAYDICVDQIGRYRASYIKSVLASWHKKGVKNKDDLLKLNEEKEKSSKSKKSSDYGTYDLTKLDDIINGD